MAHSDRDKAFVQALVNCQRSLYAYILKLVVDAGEANDILQETSLVLISKQDEFPGIKNFGGWAARIAYFQVLAHRKKSQRDHHFFDSALVQQLAEQYETELDDGDVTLRALGDCLLKLSRKDRELIEKRYVDDLPARRLASKVGRSARAISQALYRIRVALMRCIDDTLAAEGTDA